MTEGETEAGRHLVLAGRHARHRLLVMRSAATSPGGYVVAADSSMPVRLAALSAFHEDPRSPQAGAARAALKPSAYQRHRLALLLAILDRLEQSPRDPPTIRQIAGELVFPSRTFERAIDWKSSSHRRQAQRLVAEARRMMTTGYRDLLRSCTRRDGTTDHGDIRGAGGNPC